jgi:RNA polymerase sigma-B factor
MSRASRPSASHKGSNRDEHRKHDGWGDPMSQHQVLDPPHHQNPVHTPELPRPRTDTAARPQAPALEQSGDRGYEHLEPVLRRYASLAATDPARAVLREELVTGYLPIAQHIARRYSHRGEPLDDLVQVASVGLVNAVDRYDPERGHSFLGYAVPTITGEIRRHFRDKTWAMRVPRHLQELHLSVNRVVDELSHQLRRAPRPSEIAQRLNVSTEEILEALRAAQSYRPDSLDELLTPDAESTALGDLLGDTDGRLDQFTDAHSLAPHLARLPERERVILYMRFFENKTQTEIAQRIGVSQMQVSRLLAKTLAELREAVGGS